jgi:hypothetical protein
VKCRDGYPIIWVDPCLRSGHNVGYDCPGYDHKDGYILCPEHEKRWMRIRVMEWELLDKEWR